MNKFTNFFKKYGKYIAIYLIIFLISIIKLPYYIDAPGGLINVSNRIEVENKYESEGSINLAYVTEYQVNLPLLILSYFIDDWTLNKIEDDDEDINYEEMLIGDKLLMHEAYANATIVAYQYAEKDITITSTELYVGYVLNEANTDLKIGDKIVKINDKEIKNKEDLGEYINDLDVDTKIKITVINNEKTYTREAHIIEVEGIKLIGFVPIEINSFEANPKISIPTEASEYGPSGGLMVALAVYDSITEIDITGGLTIVGTGTIDLNGNVGSIGGVEYKIKGAVKKGADIFFVPVGENYEEAKKIVEKENYDIILVPVSTFEEALSYLLENVAK